MAREKVATMGANAASARRWGQPPWTIEFRAEERELPEAVDFAIVGGGFTGLAAAAWLRHLEPKKSVALFEASRVGAGSSGYTGGMALAGTASGDLPGLGDVLGGFSGILRELRVECDLTLPGALEIGREKILADLAAWRELLILDVARGQAEELLRQLEKRVRELHPVLRDVGLSHRWGGPI